ncbi:MAG: hopanoid biosynthesis-associated protein HpnK [Acidobacteria bacterium]|nr:hopanoid biosynthesis-associated protein HpnK [Acidobacteriota bacterium]MBI3428324.1 hopanoid biosynthesis-associated protein HpnK [Acidobacteriota bacterium]
MTGNQQTKAAAHFGRVPLIVNGDDFGYSDGVNRAILQAHREGILTSASLMVNESAAAEAVALAQANPTLAVGLHLVLVLGRAALPHAEIPHITDAQGRFTDSSFQAGIQYYFSQAARREVRREMRVQFEKFAATSLPFSHVDGHTHLHQHPVVFAELIRLCEEFGVRRVRVVKGEMRLSLRLDRRHLPLKLVWGTVFNLLGNWCERQLRGRGFVQPQKVYGLLQSGDLNEDYLLGLIPRMAQTTTEIYAHPLAPDADAAAQSENPGGARELQALTSAQVRQAIEQAGFALTTYETAVQYRER